MAGAWPGLDRDLVSNRAWTYAWGQVHVAFEPSHDQSMLQLSLACCRGSVDILDPDGRLLARQKMGRVVLSRREEVKITVWGSSTQSKILRFLDFYAQIGARPLQLMARQIRMKRSTVCRPARCRYLSSLM